MLPRASLLAVLVLSVPAAAGDLHVPGDYPTIQKAVDAAVDGDTIHVAAGTWPGPVDVFDLSITLQGAGADVTILDGVGTPNALSISAIENHAVTVRDLTLTGAARGVQVIATAEALLVHCTIRDNSIVGIIGEISANSCTIADNGVDGAVSFRQLLDCDVTGNGGWGAIDLAGLTGPVVSGCRFEGNALGGLRLAAASPSAFVKPVVTVDSCTFVDQNVQLSAFEPQHGGECRVRNVTLLGGTVKSMNGALILENSILRSPTPITQFSPVGSSVSYSDVQGGWPGVGNIDADPLWTDPGDGDFSLQPGSPCINSGNPLSPPDPDDSVADMGAIPYHPWSDLGGGIASGATLATLGGDGPMIGGEPVSFLLESAPPGAAAFLVVGLDALSVPFKGGIFWPDVDAVVGPLVVPAFGSLSVSGDWPAGLPTATAFWTQAWWPDAAAAEGYAATNGVKGVQP